MSDNKIIILVDKAIGGMLGAAFGDALGWPNERFAKPRISSESLSDLVGWSRRSGGRFYQYEEKISAGEYSDDTQLILAVGRSLLVGDKWWDNLTSRELPFWSFYERGGGGATKRAVSGWIKGVVPWSDKISAQGAAGYFNAGGNGVAMRVLPHVLLSAGAGRFDVISKSVFMDGIATHGHPRALVGAIAYAYALWVSLRHEGRLEYGGLITKLINDFESWSQLPNVSEEFPDWKLNAEIYMPRYADVWKSAVDETVGYFKIAKEELLKGVLVSDEVALRRLHCFDRDISGAGTVAAAASIYLASRYAPAPINGVVRAAYAIGADTDTIASMTGGLLGTICGAAWISSNREKIQDSKYLAELAQKLLMRDLSPINQFACENRFGSWADGVFDLSNGEKTVSPLGDKMIGYVRDTIQSRTGRFRVERRKLVSSYGQTFFFNRIIKNEDKKSSGFHADVEKQDLVCGGAKLVSSSLAKSRWFYKDIIGLKLKKETKDMLVFEQGLVVVPRSYLVSLPANIGRRSLIYARIEGIESCFERVEECGFKVVTKISVWGNSTVKFFRCFDPDGNLVEIFSRKLF